MILKFNNLSFSRIYYVVSSLSVVVNYASMKVVFNPSNGDIELDYICE